MITSTRPKQEAGFVELRKLIDLDYRDKKSGFEKAAEDANLSVFKKTIGGSNLVLLRIRMLFKNMSPEILFSMILDFDIRRKWDKQSLNMAVIEEFNSHEDVVYFEIKSPAMISNRDFVQHRWYLCNKDDPELVKKYGLWEKQSKYYLFAARSVQRPDVPERKGVVRAETIIAGWLLEEDPKNPNDCIMQMVLQNDIKGDIPTWIVNKVVTKIPATFQEDLTTNYKKFFKEFDAYTAEKRKKREALKKKELEIQEKKEIQAPVEEKVVEIQQEVVTTTVETVVEPTQQEEIVNVESQGELREQIVVDEQLKEYLGIDKDENGEEKIENTEVVNQENEVVITENQEVVETITQEVTTTIEIPAITTETVTQEITIEKVEEVQVTETVEKTETIQEVQVTETVEKTEETIQEVQVTETVEKTETVQVVTNEETVQVVTNEETVQVVTNEDTVQVVTKEEEVIVTKEEEVIVTKEETVAVEETIITTTTQEEVVTTAEVVTEEKVQEVTTEVVVQEQITETEVVSQESQ